MNSERKNYPMKEFRAIFSISSILVIRSGYAKKDHFSILAVIQNIWDLHKFGLQIWIQNAKITLWKNFGQFFPISSILVIRSGYAKKVQFSILVVFQNVWDSHKFGLSDLNSESQKLPYERISCNFSGFIDFGHQVRVCKKRSVSQYYLKFKIYGTYINFGLQIWIQNAKITLWKNFGQFFQFHQFWSSGPRMRKKIIS